MGLFNQQITSAGSGLYVGEQIASTQIADRITIVSALDPLILSQDNANTATNVVQIPNNLDLVLYADHLVIDGPILLPGRMVTISARILDTRTDSNKNPASISVDGNEAGDPPGPPFAPPQTGKGSDGHEGNGFLNQPDIPPGTGNAGTDGKPGSQGNPAGNAGRIALSVESLASTASLLLSANGGPGGKGQTGQSGGQGGEGGDGWVDPGWRSRPAFAGGSGGPAGDGGKGGAAGQGGKGGTGGGAGPIIFTYVNAPSITVALSSKGGSGGPGGSPGERGEGGGPGQAKPEPQGYDGPPAVRGPLGDPANDGVGGDVGESCTPTAAMIGYDELALASDPAQRLMLLQRAKLSYLAADPSDATSTAYQQTARLIVFLIKTTAMTSDGFSPDDNATLKHISAEVEVLASRLARGLDFYGNAPNWVPMVSYEAYSAIVDEMVTDISATETTAQQYFQDYATVAKATTALSAVVNQATASLASLQKQLSSTEDDATAALAAVLTGDAAVNDEKTVLLFRIGALEGRLEEIAQQEIGKQCVFENLIKALSFISTVSGDKDFKTAGDIASTAQSLIPGAGGNAGANLEAAIKQIDVLGATVTSLPEAVKTAYNSPAGPIITPDDPNAYKLLQEQSDFDNLVGKFTGLTGLAQEAIDAMNRYVSLVQQRNSDVLTYNAAINRANALKAEIAQTNSLVSQTNDQLNSANPNPQLPSLVAFVSRLYEDSKWHIIRQFYLAFRALGHWSLNTSYASFYSNGTFDLGNLDQINHGTLSAFKSVMEKDWSDALEQFGSPPQTFPADGPGIQVVIDNPDVIKSLKTNYEARFSIPPARPGMTITQTPFTRRSNVRISKARPWLIGATIARGNTTGLIEVAIRHCGREIILDNSGREFVFIHAPSDKTFSYPPQANPSNSSDILEDPNFGYVDPVNKTERKYSLLGPFTTFHLKVDPTSADLANLTHVTMEFFGTNDSFPINTAS